VADRRARTIHVHGGISEGEFVRVRQAILPMPKLTIPALQVTMKAGALPADDASGRRFLKVPVNRL